MLGIGISSISPGKIAEPVKALILKIRKGIPVSITLSSVIWERVIDIIVLLVLSAFAVNFIAADQRLFILSFIGISFFAVVASVLLTVLYSQNLGRKIFGLAVKLPVLKRIPKDFMEKFYKKNIRKTGIACSFFITLVVWLSEGLVLYLSLLAFGINISIFVLSGIIALSVIVGIASTLPGGIGTTEFSMIVLLGFLGINLALATTAVILYRFLSFWYSMAWAGASFIYLSRKMDIKNII